MFVGHLAVALGAKRSAPKVNLAWLVAAVCTLDLVWPIFVIAGVEKVSVLPGATAFTPFVFESYPWSHSLLMAGVWGAALYAIARKRHIGRPDARLLFILVLSHWLLDFVSHAPDMPLWPTASSPKFGLGLWNSIRATFAVEGALWLGAIVIYLSGRPLRGGKSKLAFWSFVGVSTLLWASGPFSPPPSAGAIGWLALVGWVMIPWAAAADKRAPSGRHA